MSLTIDQIILPERHDGPGAEPFRDYVEVRTAVETGTLGTALLTMGAEELLPEFRDNPSRLRRHYLAVLDGRPVGRAMLTTRPRAPGSGAYVGVDVLPSDRRRGIGGALLDVVTAAALDLGEPVLKVSVAHGVAEGGDRVPASTGFGDVPADDPGARFLTAHGFALEQVVRISLLDTAGLGERLLPLRAAAQEVAGRTYRLHEWIGPTPAAWQDDLAVLRTRMSTDAPMGGLQGPPDPWDAERIADHDARAAEGGNTVLTTAAEHVPSGRLVGFSEIEIPTDRPVATQEDTLVLREHRGHRLGMLIKAATAQTLLQEAPRVEAVVTWNAEENRPMLDVNETMGFRPVGYEGGWQRRGPLAGE